MTSKIYLQNEHSTVAIENGELISFQKNNK